MTQSPVFTPARRRSLILLATLAGFALTLAACGADEAVTAGDESTSTTATTQESTEESAEEPEASDPEAEEVTPDAPPVIVSRGESSLTLMPWSYCWTSAGADVGICADGEPPANPKALAGDGPITLTFPADFNFSARIFDESYGEELTDGTITKVDGGWDIDPGVEGPAVIEIFGNGPEGDVSVSFAIG